MRLYGGKLITQAIGITLSSHVRYGILLIIHTRGQNTFNDDVLLEHAGGSGWPYDHRCRPEYAETVFPRMC